MYESFVIFFAQYLIALPVVVLVGYFFYTDRKKEFALLALCGLSLTFVMGKGLGLLWYDPLPFVVGGFEPFFPHAVGNGFPSDHTLLAASIAAVVWYFNKKLSLVLFVAALAIGCARVFAGVHHAADIIGAVVVALFAVWATRKILQRLRFFV